MTNTKHENDKTASTQADLNTPWTLHFDRDGTEDYGIICDSKMNDLVASHFPSKRIAERTSKTGTFWLPESDEDETPLRVRQMRLMSAAPKLLSALLDALPYVEDVLSSPDQLACFKKGVVQRHAKAIRAAIAEAEGLVGYRAKKAAANRRTSRISSRKPLRASVSVPSGTPNLKM